MRAKRKAPLLARLRDVVIRGIRAVGRDRLATPTNLFAEVAVQGNLELTFEAGFGGEVEDFL